MSVVSERFSAFEQDALGLSVKHFRLSGKTAAALHSALVAASFTHMRVPLVAERQADGAARFRRIDGTATSDRRDPALVPVDMYVHMDGGFVRVYPMGDPRRRAVPGAGAPFATKGVLFEKPSWKVDPASGQRYLACETGFSNEAFLVTDDGHPVPKSRRAIYGLKYDPAALASSYRFAEEVMQATVVRLAPVLGAPPGGPR